MVGESNGRQQGTGGRAPVGLVLSGGGARGAYEVGVLSVLARVLSPDERPRVIVGTSVGALNAAYLAAHARDDLTETLDEGRREWQQLQFGDVIAPLALAELRRMVRYGLEAVGVPVASVRSVLDAGPLAGTIERLIRFDKIEKNVRDEVIDAAAVVATSYETGRSVVFHHSSKQALVEADDVRAIDYAPTCLTVEHVRASTAIEALFPAVEVTRPTGFDGWYGDGGTSLNTPLKPALHLGAKSLIVIGLNPVAAGARGRATRPADVFDGAAQAVQALLGDQLANDVGTLASINTRLGATRLGASGCDEEHAPDEGEDAQRIIDYIFITPRERFGIGRLASEIYRRYYAGCRGLRRARDLALVGRALDAGRNPARGELFSYVFFAPEFTSALFKEGRRDAERWLGEQNGNGPWRIGVSPNDQMPTARQASAERPATTPPAAR